MERDPAAVRIAATVLIVRDDPFQVLMVRRHAKASFASALVFPGGVIEPEDRDAAWDSLSSASADLDREGRAIRIGGIRETFEETGILLGAETQPAAGGRQFRSIVADSGAVLALDEIVPFAHWITPAGRVRRFDTHFLIARAPEGQIAIADGDETVETEWLAPAVAAARAESGESIIVFPTLMNLVRLAESADVAEALTAARNRSPFTVLPIAVEAADGSLAIEIPMAAGYAMTSYRQSGIT
jgi:8-oxo-dGTP pyrophosphatase MutT (NUDIX family)